MDAPSSTDTATQTADATTAEPQAEEQKLDAPSNLRKARREIARLKTVLHERTRAKTQK